LKQKLFNIYGFLSSFKYPKVLKEAIKAISGETIYSNREHLRLAGEWLLYMQNQDNGYSRKFSFIGGRDKSYTETTGYIIPSLIELGKYLKDERFINSALKAGKWLLEIQNSDGSFSEIDSGKPFAFDTGQCLIGLNYLYKYTNDEIYFKSAKKAAYWLKENQEEDGSWEKVAYNNQKHTYYSRVASAMYQFALLKDDKKIKQSVLKHIDWIISNREYKNRPQRKQALTLLIETLTKMCKDLGFIFSYALIKNNSLMKTYKELGYTEADSYNKEMIKKL